MGPSVKCANWPSQSNCKAISCALSSKTPTFITIHEMQPFPGKCGEMQMFKRWWRQWLSAERPLCPAQVGHDSYLLWQRPVSTHTDAHRSVYTHTVQQMFFLSLSLPCTHVTMSRRMLGNWVLSESEVSNKGTVDTPALERINYHSILRRNCTLCGFWTPQAHMGWMMVVKVKFSLCWYYESLRLWAPCTCI